MTDTLEKSVILGAGRLLQGIPKIVGFVVGLTGLAYLIGWIYARSYYKEFGALWLFREIPISTILGFSWWPLSIIVVLAYLGITDLSEGRQDIEIVTTKRFKWSLSTLKYGMWAFVVLSIASFFFMHYEVMIVSMIVKVLLIAVMFGITTGAIETIVVLLSYPNVKVNIQLVVLSYIVILFGFYFAPSHLGEFDEKVYKDPKRTSLSTAELKGEPNAKYLVLLAKEDHIYIFPEETNDRYPSIRIVKPDDIQSIQKVSRNNHEQTKNESENP